MYTLTHTHTHTLTLQKNIADYFDIPQRRHDITLQATNIHLHMKYIYICTPKYNVNFLDSSPYVINYIYTYHIYIYVYEYIWHFRPSPECPVRQRTWWKLSQPPMPMHRSWIILWWLSKVWKVPVVILEWCNLEVEQISENRSCHSGINKHLQRGNSPLPRGQFTSSPPFRLVDLPALAM